MKFSADEKYQQPLISTLVYIALRVIRKPGRHVCAYLRHADRAGKYQMRPLPPFEIYGSSRVNEDLNIRYTDVYLPVEPVKAQPKIASALDSRGAIRVAEGDVDGALDSYAESLTLARDGGFASGMVQVVEGVGMALATVDERVAALRLLSAVQAFREHAEVLPASDRARYRDTIIDLGADLPTDERDTAIAQGREFSLETAVAIALIAIGAHRARSRVPSLT